MTAGTIPVLAAIRSLRECYGAWLCDVWGVVHNGVRPFPDAVDALVRFRESGGRVVLLTNAPRPAPPILAQLARIGVPDEAFDLLVTSGDATRNWLAGLGDAAVVHIGPERDRTLFADLDLNLTGAADATIVLCTGLVDDERETPEDYDELLKSLAARGATLMCANPDLVVDRGGTLVPCAGALAARYTELGGNSIYAGKPHAPIYELALDRLGQLGCAARASRVLAIGDGIETDIAGAMAAGIDSVFIVGGIHAGRILGPDGQVDQDRLVDLFNNFERKPVAAQHVLAW